MTTKIVDVIQPGVYTLYNKTMEKSALIQSGLLKIQRSLTSYRRPTH